MIGKRVYIGSGYSFGRMEPGDYGIGPDGAWWLCAPNRDRGRLDLSKHLVELHDDGSISVLPSLVFLAEAGVTPNDGCAACLQRERDYGAMEIEGWHGWLDHGEWVNA